MPISDWVDVMPYIVTYQPVTGRDDYGAPTYGTAVDYTARVRRKHQRVVSRVTGQDTISDCQVWVAGIPSSISTDAKITLPDGSSPKIVSWDVVPDENGDHHTKFYLRG